MSSRSYRNVVNDKTVAMNAFFYGYAGHSLVTPHAALQQIWWTEERIMEKVTRDFVTSTLRPQDRERLDKPVGFGDLSDDTYMDWILEKARRFFLILAEVGVPNHIFGVIDNSWDDDDLPLRFEDIERLALSYHRKDQTDRKVYLTQFTFLLREVHEGVHIDYAPNEVLPMEYVHQLPPAVTLQNWSRIHLPAKPKEIYVRRKFSLGTAESNDASYSEFMMDIESAKMIEHEHIAPVWASYTSKGCGYLLTNFIGQHTLRSFIDHRTPPQYQKLPKQERRYLLLGWLHCLADAIATLHQNNMCHSSIRPSNILIDESNTIAFSDIGSLSFLQRDKKHDPAEMYNYGAPECHTSLAPYFLEPAKPSDSANMRKNSVSSKGSSEGSTTGPSQTQTRANSPPVKSPTASMSGFDFGFTKVKSKTEVPTPIPATEKADVFSLGCIYLDILTFMLKKKAHDFGKHRSSKHKINGSTRGMGSSRTDSSFHANMDRVESWMKVIDDAAFEHDDDAFRAVPDILSLIKAMLGRSPELRPSARDVRDRLMGILLNYTAMPDLHCGSHHHDISIAPSSARTSTISSSTTTSLRSRLSSANSDYASPITEAFHRTRISSTASDDLSTIIDSASYNGSTDSESSYASSVRTVRTQSVANTESDDASSIRTTSAQTTDTGRVSAFIDSYTNRDSALTGNTTLTGTTFFDDRSSASTIKQREEPPQSIRIAESPSVWLPPPSSPSPPASPTSAPSPYVPRVPTSPRSPQSPQPPQSPQSARPRKNSRIMPWNRPTFKMP